MLPLAAARHSVRHRTTFLIAWSVFAIQACHGTDANDVPPIYLVAHGTTDSTLDVARPALLERTESGNIVVSNNSASGLPVILDSLGRTIGDIGSRGPGPGELQMPLRVLTWNDSLIVQDAASGLLGVYSPSGQFVRMIRRTESPWPRLVQAVVFSSGGIITSGRVSTEASFGYPLHKLDSLGNVTMSWGSDERAMEPEDVMSDFRYLTRADDSTFWSAPVDRLEFELWTNDGSLLRRLSLSQTWFEPGMPLTGTVDRVRPPSRIAAIGTGPCRELLVVSALSREDWAASTEPVQGEEKFPQHSEYSRYIYQRLDAYDPMSGSLVASSILRDTLISGFMSDGTPFGFVSTESGQQVPVWWDVPPFTSCP